MIKRAAHPTEHLNATGDPGLCAPFDVVIDAAYIVVSERIGNISALLVRHKETGTLWSCHYTELGWTLPQPWYRVEVGDAVEEHNREVDANLATRRQLVSAIADILKPTFGYQAGRTATELVDSAWRFK